MTSDAALGVRQVRHAVNGVTLQVAEAGEAGAPLVILLHGFPEFWWGWRGQIAPLAGAGYRVAVPDQRGYNRSSKPEGIAAYDLDTLAADVIALADAYGTHRVRLVGHDWGGIVAWWVAARYPERVERLVAINAPHISVAGPYLRRHPTQMLRSSYMGFFQIPWLPEAMMRARDFALLRQSLVTTSRPGTFSESDLARYRDAWSQPGALTTMLNWYRALRWHSGDDAPSRIRTPTLVIWGLGDRFLERGLAEASLRLCDDGRPLWLEASHWVQHEEAAAVNEALIAFL